MLSSLKQRFLSFFRQADTSLPVIPRLTNAQISDHYSTCFKLSAENVSSKLWLEAALKMASFLFLGLGAFKMD